MESTSMVCTLNEQGYICAAAVIPDGARVGVIRVASIKDKLLSERGALLEDFNFVPVDLDKRTGPYVMSVIMNPFGSEGKQLEELFRFRHEVESITKRPCCIDMSQLPTKQTAQRQTPRAFVRSPDFRRKI